jgi:class 3 adenylate cyclase
VPVHLLRRFRGVSGVGAMLSVSSGPTTTEIARSVARRAQDAQTNTPPTTPTHLFVRGSGSTRIERNGGDAPNEEFTKCGGALYD